MPQSLPPTSRIFLLNWSIVVSQCCVSFRCKQAELLTCFKSTASSWNSEMNLARSGRPASLWPYQFSSSGSYLPSSRLCLLVFPTGLKTSGGRDRCCGFVCELSPVSAHSALPTCSKHPRPEGAAYTQCLGLNLAREHSMGQGDGWSTAQDLTNPGQWLIGGVMFSHNLYRFWASVPSAAKMTEVGIPQQSRG